MEVDVGQEAGGTQWGLEIFTVEGQIEDDFKDEIISIWIGNKKSSLRYCIIFINRYCFKI